MFSGFRTIDNNILNQFNVIQRELESAFSQTARDAENKFKNTGMYPPVNITSTDESFVIHLFASSLKADEIDITVDKNVLIIKAKREANTTSGSRVLIKERVDGSVSRRVTLPEDSDAEKITADYKLGVLTITIAKREKVKPIKVRVH